MRHRGQDVTITESPEPAGGLLASIVVASRDAAVHVDAERARDCVVGRCRTARHALLPLRDVQHSIYE
jgi:hypothetical protein